MPERQNRIEVRFRVLCSVVVDIDESRIARVLVADSEPSQPVPCPDGVVPEDYAKAVAIWLNADHCPGWKFV